MDTPEPEDVKISRRAILVGAAACALCAAAGGAGAATSRPASQPATVDAGPVAAFAKDGVYDALARSHRLLIIRNGSKLYAASAMCTHKNALLRKEAKDLQVLRCPKHDSTFDIDGIRIDGPARTSLPRFAIHVEKGRVIVDSSKVFEERAWSEEGASVTLAK